MRLRPEDGSVRTGTDLPGPPWFWLVMPVGLAAILAIIGKLFPQFYGRYLNPEIGVIETVQFAILCAATFAAGSLLLHALRSRGWLARWAVLAFICCFYVAGEEASWGQHFVGWTTPTEWGAINDQNETNLHNVSGWFDQKPRMILEIGIIIGGIVLPLLRRRGKLKNGRLAYITPPMAGIPTAAIVLIRRLDEFRMNLTASQDSLFYRSAEVQELFMYLFVLLYLLSLRRRLRTTPPPP